MAINTSKVLVGGIAAGVVMNVSGYLVQGMLLGKKMEEEMVAVAPTLAGKGMEGSAMVGRIVTQFVIGLLLAWLYSAMRPRFGPGMKTASLAAFTIWLCGFLFYLDWLYLGMMTPVTYSVMSIAMLLTLLVAGAVAGMLYKEEASV